MQRFQIYTRIVYFPVKIYLFQSLFSFHPTPFSISSCSQTISIITLTKSILHFFLTHHAPLKTLLNVVPRGTSIIIIMMMITACSSCIFKEIKECFCIGRCWHDVMIIIVIITIITGGTFGCFAVR